jgi:acetolactate synthase-1/2/3 large subunit
MIKWKQQALGFDDFGLDFNNPDFVKYAESYGANGHRIETTSELGTIINSSFKKVGVHVIEVPIDYSRNDELLNQCKI